MKAQPARYENILLLNMRSQKQDAHCMRAAWVRAALMRAALMRSCMADHIQAHVNLRSSILASYQNS